MTNVEVWLLAVSLAMDCFTVSITGGIIIRRVCWRTCLLMAFFFGLFQALMPLIGWYGASHFSHLIEQFDHWIAFGLLSFLGIRMIKEGMGDEDKCCFNPHRLKVILTLAIATSIDALAVGVSFAFMENVKVLPSCILIGCTTFVISFAGAMLGSRIPGGSGKKAGVLGGLVLIGIGLKLLIEGVFLK